MIHAGIIQVRMDSTRLPSKATKLIMGKPLLWHVINRSLQIGIPIIIATSNREIDDPIETIAKNCNVSYFRGSYKDVLDRFYQAAKKFNLKRVYRISADTPLIDPNFCKKMVSFFESNDLDYVRFGFNTVGIGMEGIKFSALETAWKESVNDFDREHVTTYIKNHPNKFSSYVIESKYNLGPYHWTVETQEDLTFVNSIFAEFNNNNFFTEDILALLKEKSYLKKTS